MPGPEQALARKRLLGWSLAFREVAPGVDLGRDLVLTDESSSSELERVEGSDNLAQSLQVALTSALGSDVLNVGFGFDGLNALAEETDPALARERVRVAVVNTLRRDPRVLRIIDLQLADDSDEPGAAGSVDSWRTVNVRVAFETVGGERASVSVGGVSTVA